MRFRAHALGALVATLLLWGGTAVEAPVAGRLTELCVEPGEQVEEDQVRAIVED